MGSLGVHELLSENPLQARHRRVRPQEASRHARSNGFLKTEWGLGLGCLGTLVAKDLVANNSSVARTRKRPTGSLLLTIEKWLFTIEPFFFRVRRRLQASSVVFLSVAAVLVSSFAGVRAWHGAPGQNRVRGGVMGGFGKA